MYAVRRQVYKSHYGYNCFSLEQCFKKCFEPLLLLQDIESEGVVNSQVIIIALVGRRFATLASLNAWLTPSGERCWLIYFDRMQHCSRWLGHPKVRPTVGNYARKILECISSFAIGIHTHWCARRDWERQILTGRQTDKQRNTHTDRQTIRQTDTTERQ